MQENNIETTNRNRLIIVGNGFDLSLGLKTSYNDFLFYYLSKEINKMYERIEKLNLIGPNTYTHEGSLLTLTGLTNKKLKDIRDEVGIFNNYKDLSDYLKKNYNLKYNFNLLNLIDDHLSIKNWVDIEILYYDTLVSQIQTIKEINVREKYISNYNNSFSHLRKELIDYLTKVKPPWAEKDQMMKYQERILHYIFNFFQNLMLNENEKFIPGKNLMFLNFNYTSSIENLFDWCDVSLAKNNYKINYIHGNLADYQSIVFGFGDELDKSYLELESDRSKGLFKYIKSPHYFQYSNYKKLNRFINQDSFEVFILGHSCGISDRTLLNEIFENDKCKLVRLFYYEKDDKSNNKLESSIELMKHFKNKIKMRNKVKPFDKKDMMFQIERLD